MAGVGTGRLRHGDSGQGDWVPDEKFVLELLTREASEVFQLGSDLEGCLEKFSSTCKQG